MITDRHTITRRSLTTAAAPAPDVLIIGAGVIGAAIAYEAASRGLRTLVLERAAGPAEGATHMSNANLSWWSKVELPGVGALCSEGLARHRVLSEELGAETGFRPLGLLVLARDAGALANLEARVSAGREHGFRGDIVTTEELRRLEPALVADAAVGGALCQGGHVDPSKLTHAWIAGATRRGAQVRYGVEVTDLAVVDGRCAGVRTVDGDVTAGQVVVAAGAWTRPLLRRAGHDIPVLHTHSEILETRSLPPILSHLVTIAPPVRPKLEESMGAPELRSRWDEGGQDELLPPCVQFDAIQFADGRVHLGQVSRAVPGFLDGPRPAGEPAIRATARAFLPALADAPAMLRGRPVAISADRQPVAGPLAEVPNLYVTSGFPGPIIYAPALARRLAAALAGEPAPELEPFGPGRFTAPAALIP